MERKKVYLLLGLVLSAVSKWLQLKHNAFVGDLLILPAATLFVLAILNYQKSYQRAMAQPEQMKETRLFTLYCCGSVMSFQLLTMVTFGWGFALGGLFALPFLMFLGLAFYSGRQLFNA